MRYLFCVILLGMGSQSCLAVAPANTKIQATATLTYQGLATPITVSVDVTVQLKTSAANLQVTSDNSVAENQASVYTLTLTTTANGADTYQFSPIITATGVENNAAPVFSFNGGDITLIVLGATAAAAQASAGDTAITVPFDGTAGAAVNGIEADDFVVVNDQEYEVASITDNTASKTITLKSPLLALVSFGTLIAERKAITVTIADIGNLNAAPPGQVQTDTTVTNSGAETSNIVHLTNVVQVTLEKFVRNVSSPNGEDGDKVTISGEEYYSGNIDTVKARRDDTLEYVIRVTAPAATALNQASISDVVPPFTTYVLASTKLNGISVSDINGDLPLIGGLTVDDDSNRDEADPPTGIIGAGNSMIVTFKVTVD